MRNLPASDGVEPSRLALAPNEVRGDTVPDNVIDRGHDGQTAHANGIEIYYVEAGGGEPLLLLNNGMASSNRVWAGHPSAYASFVDAFAEHFRVIVPDTRGSGRTVHADGPITYDLLADDVLALIKVLELDQPLKLLCAKSPPWIECGAGLRERRQGRSSGGALHLHCLARGRDHAARRGRAADCLRSRVMRRWMTSLRWRLRMRRASFLVWPRARALA